jgi:3-dehydroquinate dehydratase-1
MTTLGKMLLNSTPRVAVVITDKESNKNIQSLCVDVLEVRVDKFQSCDIDHIKGNILKRKKIGVPLILTIRNAKEEGGISHISDSVKLRIFESAAPLVDAIDIELNSLIISKVIKLAKKNKNLIIVSSHNFKDTPRDAELEKIFKNARKKGADIVKIATKANSLDDVNRLMQFTARHKKHHVITMSLGNIGSISRLTFPSAGSLLTYSYVGQPSAPGQIPLDVLQKHLRLYYPEYNQRFIGSRR